MSSDTKNNTSQWKPTGTFLSLRSEFNTHEDFIESSFARFEKNQDDILLFIYFISIFTTDTWMCPIDFFIIAADVHAREFLESTSLEITGERDIAIIIL